MSEEFFERHFNEKRKKKEPLEKPQLLDNLYKTPKRDKGLNMPHYEVYLPNYIQQADLLSLPNDNGFKYLLVVVDVGSRLTDAEPLKGKSSAEVLDAFVKIYAREILKVPHVIQVDPGAEFKGDVAKYFKDIKVRVRVGQPGRHRQQAVVERRNQIIGKLLHKRMAAQELLTEEPSTEWVDDVPILIREMNKAQKRKNKTKPKPKDDPVCEGDACHLLRIGTKVRLALDEPKDVAKGTRLHGKFRASDIRWDPKIREITDILLVPGQPPLYKLDGPAMVSYTKNQLQVVPENEEAPSSTLIKNLEKHQKFVVEKILEKKKIKGRWKYKIKWLGFPEDQNSWEPIKNIKEDVPKIAQAFEDKLLKE